MKVMMPDGSGLSEMEAIFLLYRIFFGPAKISLAE
jgi:hypothetical protein